jgi:uncharacterized protein involved in exopolysaccharide biosynthesis
MRPEEKVPENQSLATTIFSSGIQAERSKAQWSDVRLFTGRYIWIILSVCVLTVVGAYATISLLTEQYDVEASLLVKIGRETLDPPAVSRNVPLTAGLRHEEVVSEMEILKSPALIAAAVDAVGLEAFRPHRKQPTSFIGEVKEAVKSFARAVKTQYQEALIALDLKKRLDERQKAITGIMGSLAVDNVKDSDIISIRLRMPDPGLATAVEDKLISLYLTKRVDIRGTPGVKEFLDLVANKDQQQLETVEAQKEAWKKLSGIISSPDQKSLLLRQIRDLSGSAAAAAGEIDGLTKEIAESRKVLESSPEYLRGSQQETPNPAMQSIEEKLIALKLQRAQALSKYRPESGVVVSIDQEIAHLTDLLAHEKTTQIGSVTSQLNPNRLAVEQQLHQATIRLEGLRATKSQQDAEIGRLNTELEKIDQADVRLTDIERKRQVAEQNYMTVAKRKFDSDISSELDRDRVSNVSIATQPAASFEPAYPPKMLVMIVSLAVGLIFGIGLALLLNYFDDRAMTPEQVEVETGIPCLGILDAGTPS